MTSNIFPWIMGAKGRCPRLGTSHEPVVQGLCSAGRSEGRRVAFEKGLVKPAVETLTPPADTPKPRTQTSHHPSGRRTPALLLEGPERSLLGRSKNSLAPVRPAASYLSRKGPRGGGPEAKRAVPTPRESLSLLGNLKVGTTLQGYVDHQVGVRRPPHWGHMGGLAWAAAPWA